MAPRIFISHSAKESYERAAADAIHDALEADGFDPYIDYKRLAPAARWRDELFTRMYRSHGAVILFSPSALKSEFVPTEVSILGSRPYLDEGFVVVPVLLGDVTPRQVEERFSAVRVNELQFERSREPGHIAGAVVKALQPLKVRQPPETLFEKLERVMANILKDVPEGALRGAAREINADIDTWEAEAAPPLQLARELWHADVLPAACAIVNNLYDFIGTERARELLEIIAPSWVNLRSARMIPEVARGERGRRVLCINGRDVDFTAHMFVRRACCRTPKSCWPVASVSGAYGHDALADLKAEIIAALKGEIEALEDADEEEVSAILELRDTQLKEPVFVLFPPPAPPAELLEELRREFPTVTFFLLAGEEGDEAGEVAAAGHVRVLSPRLEAGQERQARLKYKTALTIITK